MTSVGRRPGGLGRGLGALIPQRIPADAPTEVSLRLIARNPLQPRRRFAEESLAELASSIRQHGVLQPVVLAQTAEGYRVVAGERRVRAAELAGLERIPAIVRQLDDRQQLAVALVENLQREDLAPLEQAQAYRRLIDEFGLTHEDVARQVGRSRPVVSNALRLLDLPSAVRAALEAGSISEGHARVALSLPEAERERFAMAVIARSLSVRQAEHLASRWRSQPEETSMAAPAIAAGGSSDADLDHVESDLRQILGTKVTLTKRGTGGRISIEWYSPDDLERIRQRLAGTPR